MRQLLVLGLALLTIPSLAATKARIQLRYQPQPKTAWTTEGQLSVKSEVKLASGEVSAADEQILLVWEDLVEGRDQTGTCGVVRQLRKWASNEEDLTPSGQIQLSVSKLCEQKPTASPFAAGLMDQPALYPVRYVGVGESWPVEQTSAGKIALNAETLTIETRFKGTGKLVSFDDKMAVLEFSLQFLSEGQNERIASSSRGTMHWTMHVDLATGVPGWQKSATVSEQTVTLGGSVVIPTRSEMVLELKTRPGAFNQEVNRP